MGLTGKVRQFADLLLCGRTEEMALKEAGLQGGKEKAIRLAEEPRVREYLRVEKRRLRQRAEEDGIVSAKEVLRELCGIAFADLGDYLEYGYRADETGEEKFFMKMKESKDVNTRNISELAVAKDGKVTFKLYSKERALFKLIDLLGLEEEPTAPGEASAFLKALQQASAEVFGEEEDFELQ